MRRIGAAEFERRRRAIGFRIAGIGRQLRCDLVGAADDRIETVEGLLAVERGADLVFERDPGIVETAAARDRERVRHVKGIERIDPAILVGGSQRNRADGDGIAGLAEKDAAATDDKVRADRAQLGACGKMRHAGIEAGADHETIVMPEQLVAVGRLQRHACRG